MASDELLSALENYSLSRGATSSSAPAPVTSTAASSPTATGSAGDDWRFDLVRSVGEECQTEAELRSLLQKKPDFSLYDGFEPSGRMHIAQGVFKALNVNKCTKAGGTFIFWVADWFALMNDKMGGDLDKIKTVGKYLIEVWTAAGMDMSRVKFLWSSDEISRHAKDYWGQALDIARRSTLARIKKCCQIMGRKEDTLTAAQILYPIMQCTDIFFLKADICQLGVDQRKVNMLARDYCDSAGRKSKPVILSHHMLYGLKAGQSKMSKSDPDSAIFMEDKPEDVERKIRNAYCPRKPEVEATANQDDEMHLVKDDLMNPCLDYLRYILFSKEGFVFKAGSKVYKTFQEAKDAFVAGELTETVLKDRLIEEVNLLLDPVRQHFEKDASAKELLDKITQWKKENLVAPPTLTRLELIKDSTPVFAVFAPQPSETVQMDTLFGVLHRLQSAPKGSQRILWLEDWSSSTLGRVGGAENCIRGFYELLVFGLKSIAPDLMKEVRVCWQGEAILSGPSEYWISVINAGRRCSLEAVRTHLPQTETLENASQVLASLMHIGDVLSLCGGGAITLCCDKYHENLHRLAVSQCEVLKLKLPEVQVVESPKLRLMQDGEGIEAEVNVALTDNEIEVNKKVKKAFCEPSNVSFCPPIAWVGELLRFKEDFVVARKPDNGGDKTYKTVAELQSDYASGALHPGDLKPSLSKALNAFFEPTRTGLKTQDVLKKAQKDLEAFTKSQQKKK
jgi:tyrosyl-tRNA synthetase